MIRTASRRDQPTHRPRQMPFPEEVGQASIHLAALRLSGGAVVVHVQGEIDMLAAPQFKREVVQVLDPAENLLALDMAQVGFLGASGLSALVDVLDAVEQAGGRLCVVFPSRAVRRARSVVGMTGRLNVYPAVPSSSRRERSAPAHTSDRPDAVSRAGPGCRSAAVINPALASRKPMN